MEEARQHSVIGRTAVKTAYRYLFWASLAALAAAIAGLFIHWQFEKYALCLWLLLIALRATMVVIDGFLAGSIIYAPDRFERKQRAWNYWAAITINSVVGLAALLMIAWVLV